MPLDGEDGEHVQMFNESKKQKERNKKPNSCPEGMFCVPVCGDFKDTNE